MKLRTNQPRQELLREATREWLADFPFTHFVTLATNDHTISRARMHYLLKAWDARVNYELIGPRWLKRPDERINWRAFPEKLHSNPHWHILLQSLDHQVDAIEGGLVLEPPWRKLISSGTVKVDRVRDRGALIYATKSLHLPANWEEFVSSLDLIRR